jgi:hypothetical protein
LVPERPGRIGVLLQTPTSIREALDNRPASRGEQGLVGPYCTGDGAGRAGGDEQVRRDAGSTFAFVPVLVSPAVCC